MKSVQEIFFDGSQKNLDKLNKALEKSGSMQYANAFSQELRNPTVADFQNLRLMVTDSFVCSYNFGALKYDVSIYPINMMNNVYRCNIWNNEYSFDTYYLVAEMADGKRMTFHSQHRNGQKNLNVYDNIVGMIRSKKAMMMQGGSQPC